MRVVGKALSCISLVFVLSFHLCSPVNKGSDSAVSVEANFTFPAIDNDNEILTFGLFKNGFKLEDNATTCTFKSTYAVSGDVRLNGGRLVLNDDLIFKNPARLINNGVFFGNDYLVEFSASMTSLVGYSEFTRAKVFLNNDLKITGTVKFRGDCLIDGRWNSVSLGSDGYILVEDNSKLTFRNLELHGLKNNNVRCLTESGQIELDNMRWVQSGNYTFSAGALKFVDDVSLVGPYVFTYDSAHTSTIATDSIFHLLDLAEITIGRKSSYLSREPLYFEDETSIWDLQDCTVHFTPSGMQLTRGHCVIDGEVTLDIQSTHSQHGLFIGDGNASNDLRFEVRPGGVVTMLNGHFINDTVDAQNFFSGNTDKKFMCRGLGTAFYTNQDIKLRNITIGVDSFGLVTQAAAGKLFYYENVTVNHPAVDYVITATLGSVAYHLNGNGSIVLQKGSYPIPSVVRATGNEIRGAGNVSGVINFSNHEAALTLGLDGYFLGNIALNGGGVTLGKDLRLEKDIMLTGSGSVTLGNYCAHLNLEDETWTSTILWSGTGGGLIFNSNIALASELSFGGEAVVDGHGCILDLKDSGSLVVRPGATLTIRNTIIAGLKDYSIRCMDDSGKIVLDNVKLIQSDSFTFTNGSFRFQNEVDFMGSSTFFYQSGMTSTIARNSELRIGEQMFVEMGKKYAYREPLYCEDNTSVWHLDGCWLTVTGLGMQLTRGTAIADKTVWVDIDSTSTTDGLILGDGTAANDTCVLLGPSAVVNFPRGHMTYDITKPNGLMSLARGAKLYAMPNLTLYTKQNLAFSNVTIESSLTSPWTLTAEAGKSISYNNATFAFPSIEYDVVGSRYDTVTTLLSGNDSLVVRVGAIPLATLVMNSGNAIAGFGGIVGPVVLFDSNATVSLGTGGGILNNIQLNGSHVAVDRGALFGEGNMFVGNGTINMQDKYINIGGSDLVSTSTLYWDCDDALIILRSNLKLTAKWTFSGSCRIISLGSNNSVVLSSLGQIAVERGSSLTFKDVNLKGLSNGRLYCLNNAGEMVFDSVTWEQDASYSFTLGHFNVVDQLAIQGKGTTFNYQTDQVSTIKTRSELLLRDGVTFYYGPSSAARNLLAFEDETGLLTLKGATLASTRTGVQLTKGQMNVKGQCYLASDALYKNEGITFGDGVDGNNDFDITIFPESGLELTTGHWSYKNLG
ncbi:MAG: hypothetical protein H6679_06035 [Epsilonproteobacteria bacterium]|nr:hypothetical protein [Campylobacterota bacterium]